MEPVAIQPVTGPMIRPDRCGNCKFAVASAGTRQLMCRRNPPTMFPLPARNGGFTTASAWPPVQPDQWCGEFALRLAAA